MVLSCCLPLRATHRSTPPTRAASVATPDTPPATEQDDASAAAPAEDACAGEDQTDGPFDESVPVAIPELRSLVTDLTGHLSADCIASISDRLRSLEDEKGAQVRVLLVGSTGDESIEAYANRVFHTWKLGRKGVDDGVLLVAALHDHHDRIEVGYGLEGRIPDAVAGDLLRTDVQPHFAAGDYGAGVSDAVDDLAHLIRGEPLPKPATKPKGKWMRWQLMVAAILLVGLTGAVAIRAQVRWFWLLTLPFITIALVDVVGLALHLQSDWAPVVLIFPFTGVAYLAGIFFGLFPKSGLLWLACTTGTFAAGVLVIRLYTHAVPPGQMTFWEIEAGMGSLVLGSMIFAMVTRNPLVGRRVYFGGSSSSGSDGGSSSSDSSSSDDFSGGGGDSGGGGASGSW